MMHTLELDNEAEAMLAQLQHATGTEAQVIIRQALETYREDIQEQAAALAALAVLGRIERGEEGTITLAEWDACQNDMGGWW